MSCECRRCGGCVLKCDCQGLPRYNGKMTKFGVTLRIVGIIGLAAYVLTAIEFGCVYDLIIRSLASLGCGASVGFCWYATGKLERK